MWAERSYIAEMVRAAGFRRVVVDVDDLESVVLVRMLRQSPWYRSKPLAYVEALKGRVYERCLLPLCFPRLVVCKEEGRRLFAPGLRHKVFVVPNGIHPFRLCDSGNEVHGGMFFVGFLNDVTNRRSVGHLVREGGLDLGEGLPQRIRR